MRPENLTVRPYEEHDQQAVIDLWLACSLVVPQNDPAQDIERKLKVSPEMFLVGTIDGTLVATVMVGYEGHRGWINYLAVAPSARRRNIGRQMMAAAENILEGVGCPKINLQVRSSNTDVLRFYEAIGYSVDSVISLGKRLNDDTPEQR